jgi:hypothetical protein
MQYGEPKLFCARRVDRESAHLCYSREGRRKKGHILPRSESRKMKLIFLNRFIYGRCHLFRLFIIFDR